MTLDEAIDHLKESLADPGHFSCAECAEQHVQLLSWLEELKDSRQSSTRCVKQYVPCATQ